MFRQLPYSENLPSDKFLLQHGSFLRTIKYIIACVSSIILYQDNTVKILTYNAIQLISGPLLPRAVRRREEGASRVQHPEEARSTRERASEAASCTRAV